MTSCVLDVMWEAVGVAFNSLHCSNHGRKSSAANLKKFTTWNTIDKGWCGVGTARKMRPLVRCCHHKLDPKSCHADLRDIEKDITTKFVPLYDKCTGWRWQLNDRGIGCTGEPKHCMKHSAKAKASKCILAAQRAMYLALDLKAFYLINAAKTGGLKAQCNANYDDDWGNTGDHTLDDDGTKSTGGGGDSSDDDDD